MVACLVDSMRLCRSPTLRGLTNRLGVAREDRAVGGAGIDVDALVVHKVVHFVPKRIAVSEAVCEREKSPAVEIVLEGKVNAIICECCTTSSFNNV